MADVRGSDRRPGDRLVGWGGVLAVVGTVATVVTFLPFLLDRPPLGLPAYLACMLLPLGLGMALLGVWRSARAQGRAMRASVDEEHPASVGYAPSDPERHPPDLPSDAGHDEVTGGSPEGHA